MTNTRAFRRSFPAWKMYDKAQNLPHVRDNWDAGFNRYVRMMFRRYPKMATESLSRCVWPQS